MDYETWYKIFCQNCDAINWVYDDTRNDTEGMKCHRCGFEDLWLEDEELELVSGGEPYKLDYVLGVEKPE